MTAVAMGGGDIPVVGVAMLRRRDDRGRPSHVVRASYVEALGRHGVAVVGLAEPSLVETYLDLIDGLLLPGGGDLPPGTYGQSQACELRLEDDATADFLLALARRALVAQVPTLGVCLGCQVLSVAAGGVLVQDLGPDVGHHQAAEAPIKHSVALVAESRMASWLGVTTAEVWSQHHQGIASPGTDLVVSGRAVDGVIEAIEHPTAPFYAGVQWHPEFDAEASASRALLAAFVAAAGERRRNRSQAASVCRP